MADRHTSPAGALVTAGHLGVSWLRAEIGLARCGVSHGRMPSFSGRSPLIRNAGVMSVGRHFSTSGQQFRTSLATGARGRMEIGNDVFVNHGAVLHAEEVSRLAHAFASATFAPSMIQTFTKWILGPALKCCLLLLKMMCG